MQWMNKTSRWWRATLKSAADGLLDFAFLRNYYYSKTPTRMFSADAGATHWRGRCVLTNVLLPRQRFHRPSPILHHHAGGARPGKTTRWRHGAPVSKRLLFSFYENYTAAVPRPVPAFRRSGSDADQGGLGHMHYYWCCCGQLDVPAAPGRLPAVCSASDLRLSRAREPISHARLFSAGGTQCRGSEIAA